MNENQFGRQLLLLRKDAGLTQDDLAARLHISPQAISKWENGHSLPETALLPNIARLLDVSIDELFNPRSLVILQALYGDGIESVNVTKRLNRLIENGALDITVSPPLLGTAAPEGRVSFLTVKFKTAHGECYRSFLDGETLRLTDADKPADPPDADYTRGARPYIIAGRYGTRAHHYDVMPKIEHYRPFGWEAYHANHEIFPSDPANDTTEYLTLVYQNSDGIHMVTCAEGERIAYEGDRLIRQAKARSCFIANVPPMPPFGEGMECSWAAALTAALTAMRITTDYIEVMGTSGACYRIAFCSPGWDYSAADALVAYDYATGGFAAYGYTPVQYHRIEKPNRAEHRARIAKEIRGAMPVLGINLRVAPDWGVICGYEKDGEVLYCRTKYDKPTIENDPAFMKGRPAFEKEWLGPYDYLQVDNWPFLLCYFDEHRSQQTQRERLISSLKTFVDCAAKTEKDGYALGFKAYEVWACDLMDEAFYEAADDDQIARRFSVNQFLTLSLFDARKAACEYLSRSCAAFEDDLLNYIRLCFQQIADIAASMHQSLDSGMALDGPQARLFWTTDKRLGQAKALSQMAALEREAYAHSQALIARWDGF